MHTFSNIVKLQFHIQTYYLSQEEYPFGGCGELLVEGQSGGGDAGLW